jgi:DNA-binding XRE family transcriptional regulator
VSHIARNSGVDETARSHEILTLSLVRMLCASGEARRRRLEAGLSLADEGAAIGVAPAVLARWEVGKVRPRRDAALRLGAFLVELQRLDEPPDGA